MIDENDHPFIHRYKKFNISNKRNRKFQILTLLGQDEEHLIEDKLEYIVHIFGVTAKGYSIHTKVQGFKPYYYVRPPSNFRLRHMETFRNFVLKNMGKHKDAVTEIKLEKKTCFMGYQEPTFFIRLEFLSRKALNYSRYMFLESKEHEDEDGKKNYYYVKKKISITGINSKPFNYKPYECNIDPILRFIHKTNIKACGWVQIDKKKYTTPVSYRLSDATTQISLIVDIEHIKPLECDDIAPISVLSFDLECTSIDRGFPQAKRKGDQIIQCGFTMHLVGKDNSKPFKYIATLDGCSPIEGAIVKSFKTEKELIRNILEIIKRIDPDIVTGYNIYGFDFKYLERRIKNFYPELEEVMITLSRLKTGFNNSNVQYKKLESSAMGQNEMWILNMDGRVTIDLYKYVQRNFKEPSYKLDYIAETYLDMNKDDVSPNQIFDFQKGSDDDRAIIAKYCIQDCLLVNLLFDILCIIPNNIGMANVCSVPFIFLFLRGQGVKGLSLVSKYCQNINYVLPFLLKNQKYKKLEDMTDEEKEDMKKYTGAIVIDANRGAYFEPIVVNDFAALYPSSSISHNLSPDRLLTNNSPPIRKEDEEHIEWTEKPKKGQKKGDKFHYIYKKPEPEEEKWKKENWPEFKSKEEEKKWVKEYNHYQANRKGRGIIPQIEIYLLSERKKYKGLKAEFKDKSKEERAKGNLELSKKYEFMSQVYDGLQNAYKITCNSLYGLLGAMTSDIKCKPVAASITCVGRQLLIFSRDQALKLFPGSEIVYGDSVSGDTPLTLKLSNEKIVVKEIQELGKIWTLYEQFKSEDSNRKEKQQSMIDAKVWTPNGWSKIKRVIRHKTRKKMYRVFSNTGCIDVTEDHSLLKENGEKIKPNELQRPQRLLHSFPDELSNSQTIRKNFWFTIESKIEAQKKYIELKKLGHDMQLSYYENRADFKGYLLLNRIKGVCPKEVMDIIELPEVTEDTFVYDLETEEGVFHAGIGELIVKNTDSIMMKYPLKSMEPGKKYLTTEEKGPLIQEAIDCGIAVEKLVSKQLPYPHCLEMEKVYFPFFLYSKKRYSAIMYEEPYKIKYVDNKGVVLTRRDNAPIVKIIFGEALRILLYEHDVPKAVHYVKSECRRLLKGEYDMKDLIISVTLKQVKKVKQAQHILAERISKRDPGNAPQLNDRILYVFVILTETQKRNIVAKQNMSITNTFSKKVKKYKKPKIKLSIDQGEKIESPEYIISNKIPVDYYHYLTNQLMKPLIDLFKAFFNDPESKLFAEIKREHYIKSNNMRPITDFFSQKS